MINLTDLTPEQIEHLKKQALDDLEKKEQKVKEDRATYKALVNERVPELFHELLGVSAQLSSVKSRVFNELQALVEMKATVFGKENTHSYSFTTDTGETIMIGTRYLDAWDDTVTSGIQKVNNYLESLVTDEKSRHLVKTVQQLLSKDKAGNLKASRVLQLKKLADETGDKDFIDAIKIIQDAYRPAKSKLFVTARCKDNNGNPLEVPLDITDAELDFKIPAAYEMHHKTKKA